MPYILIVQRLYKFYKLFHIIKYSPSFVRAGSIFVSPIRNCGYKTNSYIQDTLTRLLEECDKPLPMFDKAFLAIVEYCDYDNREVYDQDNKSWKMIPNAIKGRVVKDDEQFRLDIGLFSKISDTPACHIYVIPQTQLSEFMNYLSNDLL